MKRAVLGAAILTLVTGGAAALRLVDLDNRVMHCDEAGQALKFGLLLEQEQYTYDPFEYHGPTLNYLTLGVARCVGAKRLTEVSETHLRLAPALFGIGLVAATWLLAGQLGYGAAVCAAALAAVSPAMVFYSRYYIQEMLLVAFTLGAIIALWRFAAEVATAEEEGRETTSRGLRLRRGFWLVTLGACLGMMHATKETCVIPMFAMTAAGLLTLGGLRRLGGRRLLLSTLAVAVTAAAVSALFFSSFFDNPRGVVDSLTTYSHYFTRAAGHGSAGPHDHPWHYYLENLFWWSRGPGPPWTEVSIALLALVGSIAGVLGRGLKPSSIPIVRFLVVYTMLMTAIYSAIPYKTPWCSLGFLHGMILLGGVGAAVLVRVAPGVVLKASVVVLLTAALGHLAWQAHRASFSASTDPGNPYVYAHTTADVPLLARRIIEIADSHPGGRAMHVQVICPNDTYWPLPWYLRGLSRVGWHSEVPPDKPAPLVVTQSALEQEVLEYLYTSPPPGQRYLYAPLLPDDETGRWQLRPNLPLLVYVRADVLKASE